MTPILDALPREGQDVEAVICGVELGYIAIILTAI